MASHPPESPPLLAQVAVAELAPHMIAEAFDGSRTAVRRRAGLPRTAKRSVSILFLTLGIVSVVALLRGATAAASDGWGRDDAIPLVLLGLISAVVVSQALSLFRTMPGTRRIWRRAALARQRRAGPSPQRPLLAQADARTLLPGIGASAQRRGGGRLHSAATNVGWVVLTISIMAAAIFGTSLVARSVLRSIEARGWGLGTLLGLGVAGLIGYGVTAMSIGLIRSWFEHRRRRLPRMLMRLSRYLLRGFDRSTTVLPRMPVGFEGAAGLLGPGVLATGGAAVVVAASLAIPAMAVNGTTTIWDDLASTSPPVSIVMDEGKDNGTAVPIAAAEEVRPRVGSAETVLSDTSPDEKDATAATRKTTTKTSSSRDSTGPVVSGISDTPDPISTAGNKPDTSQISVTTTDESGVATVTMYYRISGGTFAIWATLKAGTASTTFGPFTKEGIYEYRIMTTDNLGNTNCKTPETCPGGTVTVNSTKDTTTTTTTSKTTTTTTVKTTTTTTVKTTTTTTVKTTTTTTTTTAPTDTTGPVVSDISDTPDPISTAGNKLDTSQITLTTTDKSGVAAVTMYYRISGGTFAIWTTLKAGTASTTFGPFTKEGIYEYRIMATDTLGNSNCKTAETCPGGTVTVVP